MLPQRGISTVPPTSGNGSSSQIKTASENVASVLWQSSHSTEWILSRRHLSVAALPPTSSYLGRPDCPDCDRCRSRVEIWSNCKTTLSLFIQGDIFTAPQAPIQYVVNVARRILSMQTWFKMATKMCHHFLTSTTYVSDSSWLEPLAILTLALNPWNCMPIFQTLIQLIHCNHSFAMIYRR